MASLSPSAILARESKNPVMLLNERRRALKWEEKQTSTGFVVSVIINNQTYTGNGQNKKAAKAQAALEAFRFNPSLLDNPIDYTLQNGRSPVAELNEITNASARWKVNERDDEGMIKATIIYREHEFSALGHHKRMAKNLAAKKALEGIPFIEELRKQKNNRRQVSHLNSINKDPLCEVNEKLPRQVQYSLKKDSTKDEKKSDSSASVAVTATYCNFEYEGYGSTQKEAKTDAARNLLAENPHLQNSQVTLPDGRNPLAVLHERLPDVTIDMIESGSGIFKVNAVYGNTRFEGMGFNLNLAKRRAAQKLLEKYPVFLEEIPLTANGLPPIAELAQKVLLKFQTVKAEAGHCIVRCELDSRNVFTGESWNVKIARQKCALNVLENYPLLKKDMPKLNDGRSPLHVLNAKRPALTYELEQKHDAKWIARVTIAQEQFCGEGYKKNIAKAEAAHEIIKRFGVENLDEEKERVLCLDGSHPTTKINERFPGFVSYQELGETTSSGVKIYTIQIQVRTSLGAQKFKGSGRNKKLARAKASLSALTHLFPGEY